VLALVGGTVVTSPAAAPIRDAVVIVRSGVVSAIGDRARVSVPADAKVLDCTGSMVLPGFQNSHVHLMGPGWDHADQLNADSLSGRFEHCYTRYGFTTVVDLGSPLTNTSRIRERVAAGEVRGPRVLTSGEILFPPDGIPFYAGSWAPMLRATFPQPADPDSARHAVLGLVARGADVIKLYLVTYVRRGVTRAMPADVVTAAVDEAHRRGRLVFAHPANETGLELALSSNVDVLAHVIEVAPHWSEAAARRVVAAHMTIIPTLMLFHRDPREAWISRLLSHTDHFRDLDEFRRVGGRIVMGTDAGFITDYDPALEYAFMQRAGMNASAILASLTAAPAQLFGDSLARGHLGPGTHADITVLWSDPATDVRRFADVRYTIRDGRLLYRSTGPRPLPSVPVENPPVQVLVAGGLLLAAVACLALLVRSRRRQPARTR
jgi:imidazolonepropionase-like amidohydrolase